MTRELAPDARALLDDLGERSVPPASAVTPTTARDLLDEMLATRGKPVELHTVRDLAVDGPGGNLSLRLYRPSSERPLPAVVYYHGGGWVRGSLDSHDPLCRRLSSRANCVVVSVDYRLVPEHPFPKPLEDAYAAATWVGTHAESLGVDPERVAVGGDSAGGNLATAVCLLARERDDSAFSHQLLLYPMVNRAGDMASYEENEGYFGTKRSRNWQWQQYLGCDIHSRNPLAVPLLATDHSNLPPATVLTCEFDMLRDEGQAYADRLADAGVDVTDLFYDDVFHAFLNFPELERADDAYDDIASALRSQLH
jgi:acetyl esterase